MLRHASRYCALTLATVLGASLAGSAQAAVPSVVTDIPPVHALASLVMGDLGQPILIVPPGASPHNFALRPSEAASIQSSDLIFHVDALLTPRLLRDIAKLAPRVVSVELMSSAKTQRLETRKSALFSAHDNHDHDDGSDTQEHDENREHDQHTDHDEFAEQDEHDEFTEHTERDEHDEHTERDEHDAAVGTRAQLHRDEVKGSERQHDDPTTQTEQVIEHLDPHGWLNPDNANQWLDTMAEELSRLDPVNSKIYAANAAEGRRRLNVLISRTEDAMSGLQGREFVVFHDSFYYFEQRFGISAVAALSPDDASRASPSRVQEIREALEGFEAGCLFTEPQLNPDRAGVLVDGLDVSIGVLDPLGAELTPGPQLYEQLIDGVAESLVSCLNRLPKE